MLGRDWPQRPPWTSALRSAPQPEVPRCFRGANSRKRHLFATKKSLDGDDFCPTVYPQINKLFIPILACGLTTTCAGNTSTIDRSPDLVFGAPPTGEFGHFPRGFS